MSFQKEYEDYLMHYGVKGMKWGMRKSDYYALSRNERRAVRRKVRRKRALKIAAVGAGIAAAGVGLHYANKANKNRYLKEKTRAESNKAIARAEQDLLDFDYKLGKKNNRAERDRFIDARNNQLRNELSAIRANANISDYSWKNARDLHRRTKNYERIQRTVDRATLPLIKKRRR